MRGARFLAAHLIPLQFSQVDERQGLAVLGEHAAVLVDRRLCAEALDQPPASLGRLLSRPGPPLAGGRRDLRPDGCRWRLTPCMHAEQCFLQERAELTCHICCHKAGSAALETSKCSANALATFLEVSQHNACRAQCRSLHCKYQRCIMTLKQSPLFLVRFCCTWVSDAEYIVCELHWQQRFILLIPATSQVLLAHLGGMPSQQNNIPCPGTALLRPAPCPLDELLLARRWPLR